MAGDPGGGQAPVDTAGIAANVKRAYAASQAAGTPLSDADLDAYARRESGGALGLADLANAHVAALAAPAADTHLPAGYAPGRGESANVHFADQFTAGLGPKAAALVYHLVHGVPYDEVRANQQAAMAKQEHDNPWSSRIGSVLGAIANPVNYVIPGAGEGATVAQTAGRLAAQGALSAGVQAAGHSEGPLADRAKAVALAATVGGGFGGLLGLGAGWLSSQLPMGRVASAAEATPGGTPALAARAAQLEADAPGAAVMPLDLSGQMGQAAARAAADNPTAAQDIAAAVAQRTAGAPGRVAAAIQAPQQAAEQALLARIAADNRNWSPAAVKTFAAGGTGSLYGAAPAAGLDLAEGQGGAASEAVGKAATAAVKAWGEKGSHEFVTLMGGLSPEGQQAARTAVVNKIVDDLESGDMPELTVATTKKLASVFPDKAALDGVIARVEAERYLMQSGAAATAPAAEPAAGSALALVHAVRDAINVPALSQTAGVIKAIGSGLSGHPAAAGAWLVGSGIPRAVGWANQAVGGRVGDILSQQGPDAIHQLLAALATRGPGTVPALVQGPLAGAAGQLGEQAPGLLSGPR